jgi:hypothetical protein
MSYNISIFIGNHKNVSNGEVLGFIDFNDLADEFDVCAKGGKHSAYFVRGRLDPVYRKDANLGSSKLLIIDGDEGVKGSLCDPEVVHKKLIEMDINHFIYTSHSHSDTQNKYRVVIASEMYTKLELKRLNTELLKQLDCDIKYVKEMNSWTQPWFVPTRDDPEDGLFRFYKYTDGNEWRVDKDEQPDSVDKRGEKQPDVSVESLDSMYESIRTGKEYHESTRNISYQFIKDGMSEANCIAFICSLYHGSVESGSQRWQERYNDIPRMVSGAVQRIAAESDFTVEEEKQSDSIIPELPMPPGLLGMLCDSAYDSMKIQHKELALMSSLGVLAAICGRKFNHIHGINPETGQPASALGLNIYMTIVGSTGIGKSALEKFVKWVFHNVNEGKHKSFIGPSSYTGAKALIDTMSLRLSMISVSTEAGIMLNTKSGDQEGLLSAKLNLYAQSAYNDRTDGAAYSNKDNSLEILQAPAFSQLSESTPDVLFQALRDTDALKRGLLPRQTLLVIPDYRPASRNFYASYHTNETVEHRLIELMDICSAVQAEPDPSVQFITYADDKMRGEAQDICDSYDNKRESSTAEGNMAGRMFVKLVKHASLIALFNNELTGDLVIDWESWEWAKAFLEYEETVNRIFLANLSTDDIQEAVDAVIGTLKKLLLGVHTSKKAQGKVNKDHIKAKVVGVNVLRDVLAKNPSIKALNTGAGGHSIRTGLDKVLEYLEKTGRVKVLDKNPINGRKAQMIKVLESIND